MLGHVLLEAPGLEQLDDRVRDVLGLGRLESPGLRDARVELGVDADRQHLVDLDPRPAQLGAQRLGQADHGVLGRTVRRAAREPALAGDRGELDDVAAAAGAEALERELRADDHAHDVDVDERLRGPVGLVDERADRHDPGVVDEHVERAEPALDLVEEPVKTGPVGHVEADADRARSELGRGPLGERGVEVADSDPRALRDQRGRRRAPDPTAPAGDRNHLPIERSQPSCHNSQSSSWFRYRTVAGESPFRVTGWLARSLPDIRAAGQVTAPDRDDRRVRRRDLGWRQRGTGGPGGSTMSRPVGSSRSSSSSCQ